MILGIIFRNCDLLMMMMMIRNNKYCIPVIPLGQCQFTKNLLFHSCSVAFNHNNSSSVPKKENSSKKYSQTLFLPRTGFPMKLDGERRIEMDRTIARQRLAGQYAWQRQQEGAQEYILHDGPPYANGDPHIGHAVNKILKDITIRWVEYVSSL